jgi:hypothetical protein
MAETSGQTACSWTEKIKQVFLDQNVLTNLQSIENIETYDDDSRLFLVNDTLCKSVSCHAGESKVCMVGQDVYNDIEMFTGFSDQNKSTIFDEMNFCKLSGSTMLCKRILQTPMYDMEILNARKNILEDLENKLYGHGDPVDQETFSMMAHHQKNIAWLFDDLDDTMKDLYELVFFKFSFLRLLNNSPNALTGYNFYRMFMSPLIGILSPIVYFIVPYIIMSMRLKLKIPFKLYMKIIFQTLMVGADSLSSSNSMRYVSLIFSMIFYFQGIFNSIELSKTIHKISKHLVDKTNSIVSFLKDAVIMIERYWKNDVLNNFLFIEQGQDNAALLKTFEEEKAYIDSLMPLEYSPFANYGKQLHTYLKFDKAIIKSIALKSFAIEALMSIVRFKKENDFCYVNFDVSSKLPHMECSGIRHPCINKNCVVKNDIALGGQHKNIIVTGPNAGGKSTFIKSIIINAVLAHTVCISNSDNCVMTPMFHINSQINIPDSKGYESLFEAEMYRCKHNLDELKGRDTNEFTLIVMDEIFNSTNPVEGIAGAYSIAKKISEYENCILVFTTHYTYLTKLEKATQRFLNYRMNIERGETSNITYPYKLGRGVSRQYIALELLEKNGFDEDVIKGALEIKNRLVAPKTST